MESVNPAEMNDEQANAAEEAEKRWLRARDYVYDFAPSFTALEDRHSSGPDFLCIGAQKAGTTWLFDNLANHPLIYLPPIKELSYFSSLYIEGSREGDTIHRQRQAADARTWWQASTREMVKREMLEVIDHVENENLVDDWYRRIFSCAQADQLAGDISPNYSILPRRGIRHILSINPNVKIIVILRDPVDRALSHATMLAGPEPNSNKIWQIINGDGFYTLMNYSDYPRWLARWQGMVPKENLKIEFFRSVATKPLPMLHRICKFLGIPYHPDLFPRPDKIVFAGQKVEDSLDEIRRELASRMSRIVDELHDEFPEIEREL